MELEFIDPASAAITLADRAGLTVEQAYAFFQAQAELAVYLAEEGFPIPGIGVLKAFSKPGTERIVPFGPDKGKKKKIPGGEVARLLLCASLKKLMENDNQVKIPDVIDSKMEFDEGEFE